MQVDNYVGFVFQSTPSVWRATERGPPHRRRREISIHALRVEGDLAARMRWWADEDFNPRPPCGGRRREPEMNETIKIFQSTPSVWRATQPIFWRFPPCQFQSTPSVWRATSPPMIADTCSRISIHALRVEGDILLPSKAGAS